MPFITVNEINLYYEQHGDGEDLVLICGFGSHHYRWKRILDTLAKSYRVLVFDNRGTGQSDAPPPPYSIPMMAEDTRALMDALHIPYAYILGHSMGSAILQQLCIESPAKVKKGILLNSFTKLSSACNMQLHTTGKLFQAEVAINLILETLIPWLFGSSFLDDPKNVQAIFSMFLNDPYPQGPAGFAGQLEALVQFDSEKDLGTISTPTLIVAGEQDLYTPLPGAELLHKKISGSQLSMIENAGHMIPDEKPEELLKMILSFFR